MMTTMMTGIALKATLILTGAGLLSLATRRASASLRHLLWTGALAAVLALPLVEVSGLHVELAVPAAWLPVSPLPAPDEVREDTSDEPVVPAAHTSEPDATEARRPTASSVPTAWAVAATERPVVRETATTHRAAEGTESAAAHAAATPVAERPGRASPETVVEARVEPERADGDVRASTPGAGGPPAVRFFWPTGLAGVWLLGFLGLLALTVRSHASAWRLTTRHARPAGPDVRLRLERLAALSGLRGRVRAVVSPAIRVPATWGLWRHAIVLPERAESWDESRLERVLMHELAHVRRRDCLSQLVGDLARAVHWPNPLAWIAARRLRVESERAADDEVLARGDVPSAYADDLVALARALGGAPRVPRAVLAMAGESGLGGRVRSILDPARRRGRVGRRAAAAVGAGALCVAFALAATVLVPMADAQETDAGVEAATAAQAPNEPAPTTHMSGDPSDSDQPASPSAAPARIEPPTEAGADQNATPTDDREPFWRSILPRRGVADTRLIALPAPSTQPVATLQELCIFRDSNGRRSTSHNTDENTTRIRWETDDCRVDLDIEGRVEYSDDDTRIVRMEDRATFEVEERIGRSRKRALLRADDGRIDRRYWVDGDSRPWGPEADAWLANILPQIFRHTTINAEARVRRMLAQGGPDRVFDEVAQMVSDHVARHYLQLMLEHGDLEEHHYVRVIDMAGELSSDHASAELLMAVVEEAGLRPAFQDPLLQAASGLEGDHQKGRVLGKLLESELSTEQFDAVVRAAQTIESDHQLGQILIAVAEDGGLSVAGRDAFMETLRTIDSDHQLTMVLSAFLDSGELTTQELNQVLDLTREIESDHQLSGVLRRVADDYPLSEGQIDAYLRAAGSIESDHQLGAVAGEILNRRDLSAEQLSVVLALSRRIGSSHQRAMTLTQVVEHHELTASQLDMVLEVASGIDSDHQLSTLLQVIIDDESLDAGGVLAVLELTRDMSSDHGKSQVMTNLAENHSIGGEALALYRDIAERMGSHQRNMVLAAIARR